MKIQKNLLLSIISIFIILFIGHQLIKSNSENLESNIHKLSNELVNSHALIIERTIARNTTSATILGKYIEMENGNMRRFEEYATTLHYELKGVTNLQLAPNGIVTKIYPLKGHEKAIGHDILKNDKRKKEALLAKRTSKLTLAGPFTLIQGGVAIIARKPVYIEDKFWGFTSALIMIKDLVNRTELHKLKQENFTYRLKRIHPDTNKIDIFYGDKNFNEQQIFTKKIIVPNGEWYLDIQYQGTFISNKLIFVFYLINFIIALLLGYLLYMFLNKTQELKETNKKLCKEKERFELAISGTNHGLFDWEIKTQNVYYSPRWKALLGYEDDEIKNSFKEWENRIYSEDHERVMKQVQNYLSGELKIFNVIFRMKHKNSKLIWVEARAQISRDKKGNPKRMIGFHSDVTELVEYRHSLEEKVNKQIEILRKKDQVLLEQSKLASLGEMIGNIAHQWRQPLNTMTIAASGLRLEHSLNKDISEKEVERFSDTIINNARYLSDTINTFRNYIKGGNEIKRIDIQDEINYSLNIVGTTLKDNHIKLIKNINNDSEIKVKLVLGELPQVIINIINNSKDILKEREIINPWVKIDLEKKDNKAIISIEDNAKGISEDILPNIFEPYFTTKHKSLGTGLGLYMSHKIINESLNGKLYVKNTENGAKFYIEIPINL